MNDESTMTRRSRFSYHCQACCRCCHNKRIQLNPYEIARLAHHLGISTGEFIARYMAADGPYLLFLDNSACVFLSDQGCSVHSDRPLVCRLYPLGRHLSGEGVETFSRIKPHPQSEGIYGDDGTVEEFIHAQGVPVYMQAADRYLRLFYRMFDSMWADPQMSEQHTDISDVSNRRGIDDVWLDMDAAIANYCQENNLAVPDDLDARMQLHIHIIETTLELPEEQSP
jgi:Fe-S-cluster containining protein